MRVVVLVLAAAAVLGAALSLQRQAGPTEIAMPAPFDLARVRKIVAVSDSLTNDEPTNYVALLSADLGVPVVAEAHGGWTTTSYFRPKFDGEAFARVPRDADLCLLLIGSNNLFEDEGGSPRSVQEAVEGVQRLAEHVATLAPGVRFMLIAPPQVCLPNNVLPEPRPQRRIDAHTPEMLRQLAAAYRDLAARRAWLFADLNPVLNDADFYDAAHPTPAGQRKMADTILAALRAASR